MDQLDSGTLQFSGKARRRRQQHRLRAHLFISLRYLFNYDSILPLWRDFELFGRFLDGLPFIGGLDGAEMFGALANNIDAPAGHLTVGKLKQAQCFLVCDRHRRDCLRLESHSFENAVDGHGRSDLQAGAHRGLSAFGVVIKAGCHATGILSERFRSAHTLGIRKSAGARRALRTQCERASSGCRTLGIPDIRFALLDGAVYPRETPLFPPPWRKYRTALERKLFNIAHTLPRGIHASGNATPSAELILILAHLLHGNSIAALGRRRHRATGGKTPICVGCHTAVKGAVLIYRGSGRKSEAPAPAAQQGKTAGRAELSHQKSV